MPRLENWSRMKGKSRVIPSPGMPQVGDIVGGDVYGSPNHKDGSTITTGDIVEVREKQVVTKSHGSTETYDLGKWVWDDPEMKKAYENESVRKVVG